MTDIWEEQNRFEIWVKIEIAALEAMEKINIVPKGTLSLLPVNTPLTVYTINPKGGVRSPASIANIPNIANAYGFISGTK